MPPVRTEELLSRVARVAAGAEPSEGVLPLIESVISSTQDSWQTFLLHSSGDAEMSSAHRDQIAKAMECYLDGLDAMRECAMSNQLEALALTVEQATKQVEAVRSAQRAHMATLSEGPTVFPYLNRLLLHYETVRQGTSSQQLLALLSESPVFLQWMRTELAKRDVSPADTQTVYYLQQLLEALQNTITDGGELPAIEDDLSELATLLAGSLAQPLLNEPDQGPTPLPAVNQVLNALSNCAGSADEFELLISLAGQSKNSLRNLLPLSSPPEHIEKLSLVLGSLDQLERCLTEQTSFENLEAAAASLESSACELGLCLAEAQNPKSQFTPETEGLHPLFRSVLEPAYTFLDGQGSPDEVYSAAEHLESLAENMQRESSTIDGGDERMEAMQQTLELMHEAAQMLRQLAESGNRQLLDLTKTLCFQASEGLQSAGVR